MITSDNFCHIEQVRPGVKVLFWVEYDDDEVVIHQIVGLSCATLDLKIRGPAEVIEQFWGAAPRFSAWAASFLEIAEEMGLSVQSAAAAPAKGGDA